LITNTQKIPKDPQIKQHSINIIKNLSQNEKNAIQLLKDIDKKNLLQSLDKTKQSDELYAASITCYLHLSPTLRKEVFDSIDPNNPSSLKKSVKTLVRSDPTTNVEGEIIDNALMATRGSSGGIDDYPDYSPNIETLTHPFAFAYISISWLFVYFISLYKNGSRSQIPRMFVFTAYRSVISYASFCLLNYVTKEIQFLENKPKDLDLKQFYVLSKFYRGSAILAKIFTAYFFRFTFFPSVIEILKFKGSYLWELYMY